MTSPAIDTKAAVEVAKSAAGILPQAGKTAVLDHLVSDMTPEALKALSPEAREKLLQALAGTEASPSSTQKTSPQTAQEMVDSYAFDKKTGVSTFTVPAGVTDVEAMKALNEYFRKNLPNFKRDAVYADHLEWLENLPKKFPTHCEQRDYSQARQITITGVVKGTQGENRTTQGSVLRDDSLVFSDPRDQAIAAALHACKHDGQDLFKDLWVRGSVPGFALCTYPDFGVSVDGFNADRGDVDVAASGSPSPELK
jgi:hypothetical protein